MSLFDDDKLNSLPVVNNKDKKQSATADDRFELLAKLISTPEQHSSSATIFKKLETLIRKDFLKLCAGVGIPGESSLYQELLVTLGDLQELIEFPYLANKNILAVGGGFSAGKSRFLNSILGIDQLLPEGLLPTTAIPTYLISGETESIVALNTFNRSQELDRESLNSISHAFNMGEKSTISFYHILKLIQIQSPDLKWDNIALLDTPGYSKPHSEDDSSDRRGTDAGNTDEEKAREHLSQADHLIWVISVTDGTFQLPDIEFLQQKVKWERPLYILINKADEKTQSDVKNIFERIREDALNAGFNLAGISAYSSRNKKVFFGDDPKDWFDEINQKCKFTRWRGRFQAVFEKIIAFNAEEEERCRVLKSSLDPIYLKCDEVLSQAQVEKLKDTMKIISSDSKTHAEAAKQFVIFSEKVEKLLEELLAQIGVADETASAVGIEGRYVIAEGVLPKFKKGDVLQGTVDSLSKFRGCFISSESLDDQIRIRYSDIEKHYTDPAKSFGEKKKVTLTVYEIDRAENTIVFTVLPDTADK